MNNLATQKKLGFPLPDDKHAVSVSLPDWQDVVDYEEGEERVLNALQSGYPRFFFHPITTKFFEKCKKQYAEANERCIALPSKNAALKCAEFVKEECKIIQYENENVHLLLYKDASAQKVKEFWQHTGLIISSRQAEMFLSNNTATITDAKQIIIDRIADYTGEQPNNVYLYPSGMAAIFNAFEAVTSLNPDCKTIQLGFPYVDTLKIQEKFGNGCHFIDYNNVDDLSKLEKIVNEEKIAAIFCEVPNNPLLKTIDIAELSKFLREKEVPLIIDDTIMTWENANLLQYADAIATSLTKYFSGAGDVLAGSLVLNSSSPLYTQLKTAVDNDYEDLLYIEDAIILEKNSRDFSDRMKIINSNAEILADFLQDHEKIDRVYYPKFINCDTYDNLKNDGAGYGGLLSVILKDKEQTPDFYNKLKIDKGPSLGTNFTLACPYTLLAHYNELDHVGKFGVQLELVRVSIGIEDVDKIVKDFDDALNF